MHNNAKAKLIGKGVVDLSFISKKKNTLVDVISTIMLWRNGNKAVLGVENLILLKKSVILRAIHMLQYSILVLLIKRAKFLFILSYLIMT